MDSGWRPADCGQTQLPGRVARGPEVGLQRGTFRIHEGRVLGDRAGLGVEGLVLIEVSGGEVSRERGECEAATRLEGLAAAARMADRRGRQVRPGRPDHPEDRRPLAGREHRAEPGAEGQAPSVGADEMSTWGRAARASRRNRAATSTPTTVMPRRASSQACRPGPHPRSSTQCPGRRCRTSTRKSTARALGERVAEVRAAEVVGERLEPVRAQEALLISAEAGRSGPSGRGSCGSFRWCGGSAALHPPQIGISTPILMGRVSPWRRPSSCRTRG